MHTQTSWQFLFTSCYPQNFTIDNIAFPLENTYRAWSISTNDFRKNNIKAKGETQS